GQLEQPDRPGAERHSVRHAIPDGYHARRDGALRAGQLFRGSTDRHRWHSIRAPARLPARSVESCDSMDRARPPGVPERAAHVVAGRRGDVEHRRPSVERCVRCHWRRAHRLEGFCRAALLRHQHDRHAGGASRTARATPPATGADGVAGTADDTAYSFFDRIGSGSLVVVTNDPTSVQSYKGLELTANKRFTNRWQMLAGYTFAHTTWNNFSVPNLTTPNPNSAINQNGPVVTNQYGTSAGQTGDRPHQFKLTGSYILPWQNVELAANF